MTGAQLAAEVAAQERADAEMDAALAWSRRQRPTVERDRLLAGAA